MNEAELESLDTVIEAPTPEPVAPEPEAKASETPAPAAAAPEPKVEQKAEPKTIPLAAYLEDKNKWASKFEAMEKTIAELKNPPKAAAPPQPDPDFIEDPKGYIDAQARKTQEALDKLNGKVDTTGKTAEEVANETRFNKFMSDVVTAEAQFKAQTPDYDAALVHLRELRVAEIKLLYPNVTDQQLIDGIRREEMQLAHELYQTGRNPSEYAYQLAKTRGYKPKAAADPIPPLPVVQGVKQLPPDQTLGSGSGDAGEGGETDIGKEFDEVFAEVFKRKRA